MESQNLAATGSGLASYEQVAANFGCSTAASVIDCLRKVTAEDIQKYIGDNGISFPEVTGDGTSVGKQSLPSLASGQFAQVPILIGSNANEATVFVDIAGLNGNPSVNDTLAGYGFPGLSDATIKSMYPTLSGSALISQILTDLLFTCTTRTFSDAMKAAGRSVWRYRYEGAFPNLNVFPNAGAWHSSEIPSVWGTYPLTNQFGSATKDQIALSKYMQGVWAGFAKDPTSIPWPKLGSANGVELGVLGSKNAPGAEETKPLISSDAPCAVFGPLLIAAGAAY